MTKKKSEQSTEGKAQKHAVQVLATDEFAGKGGSYIFDPASGVRTPAHQPEVLPVPTEKE